ncbi:MAG: TonB-dependent receptor [Rhodospirillaceae bacterium]|nr:MAG: TonB-dependent receptor [Rhodospirillaceae bacterium]
MGRRRMRNVSVIARWRVRVGFLAGVSILPMTALAATGDQPVDGAKLEEIVVTAQKKSENIQAVPISVTAISADQFAGSHQADLQALAGSVPNVQIGHFSNTPHGAVFNIRGMGVIEPDPYAGTTVSVVLDGVPQYFNMASLLDLFNVDRIEILRGPQGTLFGANTTGGVVNVVTKGPTGSYGGDGQATVGNYNRVDVDAAVEFPIVQDDLAGKISVVHNGRDGYFTNIVNGRPMGDVNDNAVRAYLKLTPSSNFEANLSLEYDRSRDGAPIVVNGAFPGEALYVAPGTQPTGDALPMYSSPCVPGHRCVAPAKYYSANNTVPDFSNQDMYAITLNMNWDSPIGQLTSITGYRSFSLHEDTDQDGTPLFLDATDRKTNGWQFSQELRDTFHPTDRVELLTGAFALVDHYDHYQNYLIQFAAPGFRQLNTQDQKNWSGSLFAQASVDLTQQLKMQLGIRGTHEATRMNAGISSFINLGGTATFSGDTPLPGSFIATGRKSWNDYAAKIGLNYQWTDDLMTYASFSRGFKSGGFVGRITVAADIGPYGPEHVDTYEAGVKSTWLDQTLRANLALFYNNYQDIQLAEIYFRTDPATHVTVNGNSILNAASAKTKGFEFELSALPTKGLEINAAVAYLDARYSKFNYSDPNAGGAIVNLSGKRMQNAPPWTATAGFKYTFAVLSGDTTIGAQYRFTAPKYEEGLTNPIRSYIQSMSYIDANIEWTPDNSKWSIGYWVRNLTDRHYIESVYDAPGIFGLVAYSPPREMGVTVKFHW